MGGFLFDLDSFMEEENEKVSTKDTKYSLWIQNNENYSPVTSAKLTKTLEPGMYKIDKDLNCGKINIKSDKILQTSDSLATKILNDVTKFWAAEDNFKSNELLHKRGILLEGAPGTGKSSLITLLINAVIEKNGIVFSVGNVNDFLRTVDFYQNILRKIQPATPVITIIEDIDKLYTHLEPELLDFLDGKSSINHSLTILTTNNSSNLSSALLRPSRIDRRYVIGTPSNQARREYFEFKNVDSKLIDKYVDATANMNISQLKELFISTIVLENDFDLTIQDLNEKPKLDNYLLETETSLGLTE